MQWKRLYLSGTLPGNIQKMRTMDNITPFLILLFVTTLTFAQPKMIKKADKDFEKYAFIDAQEIYLKLLEDGKGSPSIYKNLADSYYWNSEYIQAAPYYMRLIEQYPAMAETIYYYRAAQSLKSAKQYGQAKQMMDMYVAMGGGPLIAENYVKDTVYLNKKYLLQLTDINTPMSDFGPSYYGKSRLVFASSGSTTKGSKIHEWNEQPFLDLFEADLDSLGVLSNVRPLPGEINTPYHESGAAFSHDGKTVYFTRNNYTNGKKKRDKEKTVRLKLYKATKKEDNSWSDVEELPFNNDAYSIGHPTLNADGKKLYFSSDMPGSMGMSDIYYVEINEDGTYGYPVNLGPLLNTEAREVFPYINENNELFFSSDGHGGLGGYDIFKVPLNDWGKPKPNEISNLGEPTNSNQDDFGFIFKEDKQMGFLTSNRSEMGGSINDEIYRIKTACEVSVVGTVFDSVTLELLPGAEVSLLDKDNNLLSKAVVGEDGSFQFMVDCDQTFSVRGQKENYTSNEETILTPKESGTVTVPVPLDPPCANNDLGCQLNLQPIYFDFDKDNIRPDAEKELNIVAEAMKQYPKLVLHIESHTDSRGSENYNERLSDRRAKSTMRWLIDNNIDKDRLSAKGYGENRLVNKCSNGVACSEKEHQGNRRSMFIIQNPEVIDKPFKN